MRSYHLSASQLEVGLDEAGRGPILGRVYVGAVIWSDQIVIPAGIEIKDSKKYSTSKAREQAYQFIVDHAIAYATSYVEVEQIDQMGIGRAVMQAMHSAIDQLNISPDHLLVDGNWFSPYEDAISKQYINHTCVVDGDNQYYSIAGASVLAKVERDRYIKQLCQLYPVLDSYYGLSKNKGYGTKQHLNGIKTYGITQYHRLSFKCCHNLPKIQIT